MIAIALWPSRDPIGERGEWNLYEFVGNDGVNWLDYLAEGGRTKYLQTLETMQLFRPGPYCRKAK